jgi:hypothetical protein
MTLSRGASSVAADGALRIYTLDRDSQSKQSGPMGKQSSTSKRLQAILRGAFAGPPTPLKDIPTRDGEQRAVRKDQRQLRRRRQRKNRAA